LEPANAFSTASGCLSIIVSNTHACPSGAAALPALDHDQIIVLPLEAGCGKVRAVGVPDQRRLALISTTVLL